MNHLLPLFVLVIGFISQSVSQHCSFATNYQDYSRCVSGQYVCSSPGCTSQPLMQCPPGTFLHDNTCNQLSKISCPSNTVYGNGACQSTAEYQCPSSYSYKNGVCVNQRAALCSEDPQNCVTRICQSSNYITGGCQMQQCAQNSVYLDGGCAPATVATCPAGTVLKDGQCVRTIVFTRSQKLQCTTGCV